MKELKTFQKILKRAFSFSAYALFLIFSIVALFMATEVASRFVFKRMDTRKNKSAVERFAKLPVYDGYEWREDVFRDYYKMWSCNYQPYSVWSLRAYASATTTIDANGKRKVTPPAEGYADAPKSVFLFGGSTMLGVGVPDEWTIPSLLQQKVGDAFRLENFATPGFVAEQSLHRLVVELRRGNVPDVVIFYDGINDAYSGAYSPAEPGTHQYLDNYRPRDRGGWVKRWKDESSVARMLRALKHRILRTPTERVAWERNVLSQRLPSLAKQTVDVYIECTGVVRQLGKAYHFETIFFWQPVLAWKREAIQPYEKVLIEKEPPVLSQAITSVYAEADARFTKIDHVQNVADIFEKVDEPLYWDWAHLGPRGNELIAARIYDTVKAKGIW